MSTKKCAGCDRILDMETCFWKNGPNRYAARCHTHGCHQKQRRDNYVYKPKPKRPTGLAKLTSETRKKLLDMTADKINNAEIARATGIKYNTIRLWIRNGKLEAAREAQA